MPIVTDHLADEQYTDEQVQQLLTANARVYAEILECPDRVRGFVRTNRPQMCLVAGEVVANASAIGGVPASIRRRDEVHARAEAHQ